MKALLIIHQSAELYGSDKTLLLLLSELDKSEFLPVVILPGDGPLKTELEARGIKVYLLPVLKVYRKMFTPKNMLAFVKDIRISVKFLKGLNKQYKFSLVYSNTLAVLLGMIIAQRLKIKHIWHVHEIIVHPKPIAAAYPVLLNKFTDVVICNSQATKNNLTQRKPALEQKCVVVYNGLEAVAPTITDTDSTRNALGFLPTDVVVTLVGRISRLKGHKWLLNTYINHLKDTNLKLLFVGSPVPGQEYYLTEIEALIAQHQLQDTVKILEFTTNLAPVWNVTDIAIMPSTEAESFGLVALEAMLAKKPVIGSNHGGVAEIIVNGETGLLVAPANEQALADAFFALLNSPELIGRFGQAGYERAITKFSLDNYTNGITKLLRTV
jgi:glycosyltransferase involved in cell wall biosynthesis